MTESNGRPGTEPLAEKSISEIIGETMERVDTKVDAVLDIRHTLEQVENDATPEEVSLALESVWHRTVNSFSPEVVRQYTKLQAIEAKLTELYQKEHSFQDINTSFDPDEIQQVRAEMKTLRQEALPLFVHQDIQFIVNIGDVLGTLRKKNLEIGPLRNQPQKIVEVFNNLLRTKEISPADVVAVHEQPFEIALVLKPQIYEQVTDRSGNGLHYQHSFFSVIKSGPATQRALNHESIHNFIDGASGIGLLSRSRIEDRVKAYTETEDAHERAKIAEEALSTSPAQLLDLLHNELMAELENWEQLPPQQDRPPLFFIDRNRPRSFEFHAKRYSTAGGDAYTIVNSFEIIADHTPEKATREQLRQASQEFQRRFTEAIECMRSALRTARKLGDTAVDGLHALMFVLPPSRYSFLERYIKNRYSPDDKS